SALCYVCSSGPPGSGEAPVWHLCRDGAAVAPDRVDDRNVDAGKDVYGHRDDRHNTQYGDQHRQHDERVRSTERESNYPHCLLPSSFLQWELVRCCTYEFDFVFYVHSDGRRLVIAPYFIRELSQF